MTSSGLRGGAVDVPVGDISLGGFLVLPPCERGLVLVAHASRTARPATWIRTLLGLLLEARFGTFSLDLLAGDEEGGDALLLGGRVVGALTWLDGEAVVEDLPPSVRHLPVGCLGTGAGAAAALVAAAERGDRVGAVVSWNGRPELAPEALGRVHAPTLLSVDAGDTKAEHVNRRARTALGGEVGFVLVDDPDQGAALARDWFEAHLAE